MSDLGMHNSFNEEITRYEVVTIKDEDLEMGKFDKVMARYLAQPGTLAMCEPNATNIKYGTTTFVYYEVTQKESK